MAAWSTHLVITTLAKSLPIFARATDELTSRKCPTSGDLEEVNRRVEVFCEVSSPRASSCNRVYINEPIRVLVLASV